MPGFRKALLMATGALAPIVVLTGASSALAQSLVQPPVLSTIDANGVNLADGKFVLPGANVSIGTSSSGLQRTVEEGGSDNYANYGNIAPSGSNLMLTVSYAGVTYEFVVGTYNSNTGGVVFNQSTFQALGAPGTSITCASGASGPCTLYLGDGTKVVYTTALHGPTGDWGVMQSATLPSGEVINETYYTPGNGTAAAVKAVTSSKGWMLWFTVDSSYRVSQVTALNTSQTWCDPNGTSCSPGSSYPYATDTISGTTHTIAQNGTTLVTYSSSGSTTTLTSPLGVTTTVTTNTNTGQVTSVTRGGSTWNYTYSTDGAGSLTTTVKEPNLNSYSTQVSSLGQVIAITDEAGRVQKYTYYPLVNGTPGGYSGALYQSISPDVTMSGTTPTGGYTIYTYNSAGMPASSTTYPKGGGTPIVVSETYAGPACNGGSNNAVCNKPTSSTDANGVVTYYSYDSYGDLLTATLPAQSNGVQPETAYTYSPITPYIYTSSSGTTAQAPVMVLTQTASCMTSAWNGSGCTGGTADERKTAVAYNTSNVLSISTTMSLGDGSLPQTITTTYNNNGWVLTTQGVQQAAADEGYTFYDALGRQIGTVGVDPDGTGPRHRQATATYYDSDGHVKEVDSGIVGTGTSTAYSGGDPVTRNSQAYSDWTAMTSTSSLVQGRNVNEFDSYGRPLIAAHYIGNATTPVSATQRSYDTEQRVQCEAVRLNSTDYASDFSNLKSLGACALGTTGSDGSHDRITAYTYDKLSKITNTVSAYATPSARSDFTQLYDDLSTTSTGTLTYAEDADGNRTSYFYDLFDRLIETCMPLPTATHTSSTTDCAQTVYRTTSVTGASQEGTLTDHLILRDGTTNSLHYDLLGRVSSISGGESQTLTYDNFNEVLTHSTSTLGTTGTETFIFNALGWLKSDAQPNGTIQYAYDAFGRRHQMTYPGGYYLVYNYDVADEMTALLENGSTQLAGFNYDDYGHRNSLTRANGVTTTYGYDSNLRIGTLTQGSSGAGFYNQVTYGYNAANQIVSKAATNSSYNYVPGSNTSLYGIDDQNRITAVNSGAAFTYDGRGNLTGDGSGSIYTYNVDNLLISAQQSGVTSTLTYDPSNRLYQIAKNGSTTQFLYDGSDLLMEWNGSGSLQKLYVHGPGDDEPLVSYDYTNGAAKTYLHSDDNGSITLQTNSSGATTVPINTYNEYGLQGGNNSGRFQYTGQEWLTEVGMYYYKARLYNPAIGRFLQTDPIGYTDGMNWYNYVHGDPVNEKDSTGLEAQGADNCDQVATFNHEVFSGTTGLLIPSESYSTPIYGNCESATLSNIYSPEFVVSQNSLTLIGFGDKLLSSSQRQNIRNNLKGLFPGLTDAQIDKLISQITGNIFAMSDAAGIGNIKTKMVGGREIAYMTQQQEQSCVRVLNDVHSPESNQARQMFYGAIRSGTVIIEN